MRYGTPSSPRSSVSQSCARFVCFASFVHSVITVLFCCTFPFLWCFLCFANVRSWEFSTIEVMYLSFRRSKDALLALGFFVLMVVIVFSTLLYVRILFSLYSLGSSQNSSRYFIERGTWDDTLEVFINSDGDSSQFAVSPLCPFLVLCLSNSLHTSLYPPQRGT